MVVVLFSSEITVSFVGIGLPSASTPEYSVVVLSVSFSLTVFLVNSLAELYSSVIFPSFDWIVEVWFSELIVSVLSSLYSIMMLPSESIWQLLMFSLDCEILSTKLNKVLGSISFNPCSFKNLLASRLESLPLPAASFKSSRNLFSSSLSSTPLAFPPFLSTASKIFFSSSEKILSFFSFLASRIMPPCCIFAKSSCWAFRPLPKEMLSTMSKPFELFRYKDINGFNLGVLQEN